MSNNKNSNRKELRKSNVTDTSARTKSISNNKRVIQQSDFKIRTPTKTPLKENQENTNRDNSTYKLISNTNDKTKISKQENKSLSFNGIILSEKNIVDQLHAKLSNTNGQVKSISFKECRINDGTFKMLLKFFSK